jgi:hypothetical protein
MLIVHGRLGADPPRSPFPQLVYHIVTFANRGEGEEYTHCGPDFTSRRDNIPGRHACIDPAAEVPASGGQSAGLQLNREPGQVSLNRGLDLPGR